MTPYDELEVERVLEIIRLLNLALGHCYTYLEELRAATAAEAGQKRLVQ